MTNSQPSENVGERTPDESPGAVIAAEPDGTIVLDDGITTWNPRRAKAFLAARCGGSRRLPRDHEGIPGGGLELCPGCPDCQPECPICRSNDHGEPHCPDPYHKASTPTPPHGGEA